MLQGAALASLSPPGVPPQSLLKSPHLLKEASSLVVQAFIPSYSGGQSRGIKVQGQLSETLPQNQIGEGGWGSAVDCLPGLCGDMASIPSIGKRRMRMRRRGTLALFDYIYKGRIHQFVTLEFKP